ncbi:PiggyBac transposable element-derived protein 3 [Trichinella nelsoni]|uniref:PiggyBac transposable element-derived protein 3 n=1 Tax=Trichinella nelsoni TaxID=6336 RepID=A0A0V0RPJ7_9BILA|nr:PiggyBac transposable element-derived protein 3 [Trichinella nelsoni]
MHVCRWNDSTAVATASNYYTHFPVGSVKRFSRAVKKHVDVAEPNIIRQYNQYMYGVDWQLGNCTWSYTQQLVTSCHIYSSAGKSPAIYCICKKPPGATVTLTSKPPAISQTPPPIMYPRTMCSLR